MSRIGKKPIALPKDVEAKIDGKTITVKGPLGELKENIHHLIDIEIKDDQIILTVKNSEERKQKALWGLFRSLVANMVEGVSKGFKKKLEIYGIGFKAAITDNTLILNVGFSHPVEYKLPEGVKAEIEKNIITVSGLDKQKVGQVAAEIRAIRKPEPYKGKGIRYKGELIRRKVGKATVKTE